MEDPNNSLVSEADKGFVSIEILQLNIRLIERVRTVSYIVGGISCGILGFTSLNGLIFILATELITSLLLNIKMGLQLKKYTNATLLSFLMGGIQNNSMSFVLFWTLSYALVYIY